MTKIRKASMAAVLASIGLIAGGAAWGADLKLSLSGANEVPPVTSAATGSGTLSVGDDGSLAGSIVVTGVEAKAAHIHLGAAGKNGPVIVPLTKDGNAFNVPAGARLDAEQLKAFKAGGLYVNVHSAANPGGEIRAQLQ